MMTQVDHAQRFKKVVQCILIELGSRLTGQILLGRMQIMHRFGNIYEMILSLMSGLRA
jgi:hypothetical protein